MRIITAAAILLGSPSIASAQPLQDPLAMLGIKIVEPMSAKELASTKARVAAELARSGTTLFFEDISDQNSGRARHRSSGLICPLGKKGQSIVQASADFAICQTTNNGATYNIAVERAPAGATLESVAALSLEKAQQEPGFKPNRGISVIGSPRAGSGGLEHRTIRYSSKAGGRPRGIRLQVGLVRGWILSERQAVKQGAQGNTMADLLSEATFGISMKQP